MPRPYLANLRGRVLQAHEAGSPGQRVLATRFGVSTGAAEKGAAGLQGDRLQARHGQPELA